MRDTGMGRKDVASVKQKLGKHRSRENKGTKGRKQKLHMTEGPGECTLHECIATSTGFAGKI